MEDDKYEPKPQKVEVEKLVTNTGTSRSRKPGQIKKISKDLDPTDRFISDRPEFSKEYRYADKNI
jgi:hypothetical protein